MNKLHAAVAACFAVAGSAQAATYGGFVVFGDSLSDAGTYSLVVPAGGRFTTNPGPVWSEDVSTALGFAPAPAQFFNGTGFTANPGGNIWAQGGARVNAVPGFGAAPASAAEPVSTQLSTYLASGGAVGGNTLYAFWAGANDIFTQATSGASSTVIQANVGIAAQDLTIQVARLQAAGGRYVIVYNLPDIGQTPYALSQGAATMAALSGLSQLYNMSLNTALNAAGGQTLRLDMYRLFNEILASPATYGFAVGNTGVACTTTSSLICTTADLVTPTAASTYVFADGVHPTTAAHQVIAQYTLSVLNAPVAAARAADRMAATMDGQWLASDTRQGRFLDGLQAEGGGDVYVTGQASHARMGAENDQPELSGNPYALRVGADRNFGGGWFGGISVAFVSDKYDLTGSGKARGQGVAVTAYGSKRSGPLYVSAAGTVTSMNYDVKRDFMLGAASREEAGTASGSVDGLRVEAGYDLAQGTLRHGPLAALSYRQVWMAGYSETSGSSTAVAYGNQKFDLLRSSLGYQASWQAAEGVRLSGRLTWEDEMQNSKRDLSFGLATNEGRIAVPVGIDGGSYAQLNLGADWALGRASALSAVLSATSSRHGSHQEAILVSYSNRF